MVGPKEYSAIAAGFLANNFEWLFRSEGRGFKKSCYAIASKVTRIVRKRLKEILVNI